MKTFIDCLTKGLKDSFLAAGMDIPVYDEVPTQGANQPYCLVVEVSSLSTLQTQNERYRKTQVVTTYEISYAENTDGPGYTKAYKAVDGIIRSALVEVMVPVGKGEELRPFRPMGSLMKSVTDNILVYVVMYAEYVYDYTDNIPMTETLTTTLESKEI